MKWRRIVSLTRGHRFDFFYDAISCAFVDWCDYTFMMYLLVKEFITIIIMDNFKLMHGIITLINNWLPYFRSTVNNRYDPVKT